MIMGDIELSPQLGVDCHNDVQNHCSDAPKNQEGAVINCLLALAPLVIHIFHLVVLKYRLSFSIC